MLTYRETRVEKDAAHRDGANDLKDRVLAQVRSRRLDAEDVSPRSPVEKSYHAGFNDALAALETWLEGVSS